MTKSATIPSSSCFEGTCPAPWLSMWLQPQGRGVRRDEHRSICSRSVQRWQRRQRRRRQRRQRRSGASYKKTENGRREGRVVRYDQHGSNKVGGRKRNSTTISKHVEITASTAACFARMVPAKRTHDGTSAPPGAPVACRTQRWQRGSSWCGVTTRPAKYERPISQRLAPFSSRMNCSPSGFTYATTREVYAGQRPGRCAER